MRRFTLALLFATTALATPAAATSHTLFDSGSDFLEENQTFEHTFTQAGTYRYHCTPHTFMTGTVLVDPSSTETGTVDVVIKDFEYVPATVTIGPGATVRWTNEGPTAHTATEDADSPGPSQLPGQDEGDDTGGASPGIGAVGLVLAVSVALAARRR